MSRFVGVAMAGGGGGFPRQHCAAVFPFSSSICILATCGDGWRRTTRCAGLIQKGVVRRVPCMRAGIEQQQKKATARRILERNRTERGSCTPAAHILKRACKTCTCVYVYGWLFRYFSTADVSHTVLDTLTPSPPGRSITVPGADSARP